ncbi:5-methylthioadenosine/S-adenosylhomocysteine deaminase [Enterococcus sp. PF1-24]|uniref:amidohydrolase n=1 Tax=unclassified Enterococcus TaxID=2608891 RepID=UPI002475D2FE|nr:MULTISPECIES: amidohydrolase [unclassified Enterococcus]MDH6363539.1 5-methylthioadenosine/S-adenosylhomocysteine deaminase [Enterococcus sp. PFB1-1]MDH6400774.1 5-methylthioadenosine/S-adenosylhomocysteine deaminase [Enterococcus sp. PF1-24]
MKTLIKNVHVLTMDEHRQEYKNGYLLIEDERIIAVGAMPESLPAAEKVIDGAGGILLPGFVNTHTHCGMIPFRSLGDDVPDRLRRFLFPLENAYMTKDLVKASSAYAIAEMLLSGVTSFCDMYYFEDEVAEVCHAMQVRAVVGETIIDMPTCDSPNTQASLAYCEKLLQKWQQHPLIKPAIAPHAPNTNKIADLQAIVALSQKYQAPITMHVAEMDYEMTEFAEKYQQTPLAFLADLGYLDCEFILAHGIHLTQADIELLAAAKGQVSVAHCIAANTKSAKGVAPVKELVAQGITVGLGTDGPSSGNTLDLFTQMRMVVNFHKTKNHDRALFPAKEIVAMATTNGAKALGFKDVGSLEVGKKADLVLVETQSVNMFPIYDAYSALVYSANASNVAAVWVNGQQLVKNKELVHENLTDLRATLYQKMDKFVAAARQQ